MTKLTTHLVLTGACLVLAACAARGPAFTDAPPPGTKALVYIYRAPGIVASAQPAGFDVTDKVVATLSPGGYTYFHIAPGHHEIKQYWPVSLISITSPGLWQSISLPLDAKAGETHYLRFDTGMGGTSPYGGQNIQWQLAEVPVETARHEIAQEKFQPQDRNMPAEFKP